MRSRPWKKLKHQDASGSDPQPSGTMLLQVTPSWLRNCELHRLKAGGFRLRLKAGFSPPSADSDGGCGSSDLEVIVRLWCCLILDILGPYLIGNVAAAGDPISSSP